MDRDFKGVWIPRELYLNTELSWSEKILLVEIDSLDIDENKGCYATAKRLAEFLGVGEGTARNMIRSLKMKGFLKQLWTDGKNRGLRSLISFDKRNKKVTQTTQKRNEKVTDKRNKKMHDVSQKNAGSVIKKCTPYKEYSNTRDNTREEEASPPRKKRNKSDSLKTRPDLSGKEYLAWLATQPDYSGIDVYQIYRAMDAWCKKNDKPLSRRRLLNWLKSESDDVPLVAVESNGPRSKFTHTI